MHRLSTSEAREQLADLVNRVAFAKEAIILTRHGKDLAVLLPVEALEKLRDVELGHRPAERTSGRRRPYLEDTVEVAPIRSRRR